MNMVHTYELWETAIGKRFARYVSAPEMATLIRTLASRHGEAIVGALELYVEDESGETIKTYTGPEVVAWADGVVGGSGAVSAPVPADPPQTYSSHSGGVGASRYGSSYVEGAGLPMAASGQRSTTRSPGGPKPLAPRRGLLCKRDG